MTQRNQKMRAEIAVVEPKRGDLLDKYNAQQIALPDTLVRGLTVHKIA